MENILLIGSGGREHALAWKLSQSEKVKHIFVSPGNAGTCLEDKASNVDLPINDHEMIAQWCSESKIKLVVVGPEAPLAAGLSDVLSLHGIHCFGPSKAAARIESSKEFSKSFMDCHRIPTAKWKSFTDTDNAMDYIKEWKGDGLVVKASGLAAGKGVIVADTKEQAMEAALEILELKKFGSAGDTIVVEERLIGEEISVFGFSDGERVFAFPPAQDYKRAYNDDKGPNTGGMGAYAPVPNISDVILEFVGTEVLQKTVDGMKQEGCPFVGLLYAGLMLTEDGPKVLEFNCRFGDPETEALLTLLKSDLYTTMLSCCEGRLIPPVFDWSRKAVTVVLASGGYPNVYKKGVPIQGLAEVKKLEETHMFHAGTKSDTTGTVITSRGRVFALTSTGGSFEEARERAYHAVGCVSFEGVTQRTDIAAKVVKRCGGLSYADSGVDIAAGSSLVEQIKPMALETARSGCMDGLGGFGALFDLRAAGYTDPILVSGTDGVGTKLKVALACKNHRTVGVDLVAMCVNDILAQGAEPLFFLDYYACGKLDTSEAAQVVVGIAEGCKQAGCALLGGETAEMPGMYKASEYDLAGFAVGAVDRACVLPNMDAISAGDCVIGLPSSGVHSNGFSLVRKIVERSGLKYTDQSPFSDKDVSLGEALLEPTKIYVKSILPLMKSGKVKAFAHITGGGLMENIPRVLPPGLSCLLDVHSWSMPKVFGWLYKQGALTADEMLKTFNCGLGGVLIVESRHAEEVLRHLQCEQASSVGILGHKMQDKPQVQVKGIQTSLEMSFNLPIQRHVKSARMKVACLISGSGTNLQALIDHTLKTDSSAEIRIVISNVPDVKGLERAKKAGIKTQVINHKTFVSRLDFDKAVLTTLQSEGVELVCLAGFMRILTAEFVRHWSGRLINIHPSLLPSFRGMNAHQQALEAGVRISGCTVHYVVEEIDAGGIISQGVVEVKTGDTVETLQERVKEKEWQVYPLAMEMIASGRVRQEEGKVIFS